MCMYCFQNWLADFGDLNILQALIHGNKGKHVALVGKENYYLKYDVMVGAFNSIGDGPNSTSVDVYSAEGRKLCKLF